MAVKLKIQMNKSLSSLFILCILCTLMQSCSIVHKTVSAEQNTQNTTAEQSEKVSIHNDYFLNDTIQIKTLYHAYYLNLPPYHFCHYGFYIMVKSDTSWSNILLNAANEGIPFVYSFKNLHGNDESEFMFDKTSSTLWSLRLNNVDSFKTISSSYYPSGRLKGKYLNSPLTEGNHFKLEENGDTIYVMHNCLNYFKDTIPYKQYQLLKGVRVVSVQDGEGRIFQKGKLEQIQRWQDGKLIFTQYQDTSLQVEKLPKSLPITTDSMQIIQLSPSARIRYKMVPSDSASVASAPTKPKYYELIQEERIGSNWQVKMTYIANNGINKELTYFDELRNQYHIYYYPVTGTVSHLEFTNALHTKRVTMYFYPDGNLKRQKEKDLPKKEKLKS